MRLNLNLAGPHIATIPISKQLFGGLMKVRLLVSSLLISVAAAYSIEAQAQAYSIPAGFASSGEDLRNGYTWGVNSIPYNGLGSLIGSLGCLPTDIQTGKQDYSQIMMSKGSLAAGQVVEFTQTICDAEGRTPGFLEASAFIFYKGDLSGQVISPSGKVYELLPFLQNSFQPTRYALQAVDWYRAFDGNSIARLEPGVWRLRLQAGRRGASIPHMRWSATSNFRLPF